MDNLVNGTLQVLGMRLQAFQPGWLWLRRQPNDSTIAHNVHRFTRGKYPIENLVDVCP
jgi:hypothetical protein